MAPRKVLPVRSARKPDVKYAAMLQDMLPPSADQPGSTPNTPVPAQANADTTSNERQKLRREANRLRILDCLDKIAESFPLGEIFSNLNTAALAKAWEGRLWGVYERTGSYNMYKEEAKEAVDQLEEWKTTWLATSNIGRTSFIEHVKKHHSLEVQFKQGADVTPAEDNQQTSDLPPTSVDFADIPEIPFDPEFDEEPPNQSGGNLPASVDFPDIAEIPFDPEFDEPPNQSGGDLPVSVDFPDIPEIPFDPEFDEPPNQSGGDLPVSGEDGNNASTTGQETQPASTGTPVDPSLEPSTTVIEPQASSVGTSENPFDVFTPESREPQALSGETSVAPPLETPTISYAPPQDAVSIDPILFSIKEFTVPLPGSSSFQGPEMDGVDFHPTVETPVIPQVHAQVPTTTVVEPSEDVQMTETSTVLPRSQEPATSTVDVQMGEAVSIPHSQEPTASTVDVNMGEAVSMPPTGVENPVPHNEDVLMTSEEQPESSAGTTMPVTGASSTGGRSGMGFRTGFSGPSSRAVQPATYVFSPGSFIFNGLGAKKPKPPSSASSSMGPPSAPASATIGKQKSSASSSATPSTPASTPSGGIAKTTKTEAKPDSGSKATSNTEGTKASSAPAGTKSVSSVAPAAATSGGSKPQADVKPSSGPSSTEQAPKPEATKPMFSLSGINFGGKVASSKPSPKPTFSFGGPIPSFSEMLKPVVPEAVVKASVPSSKIAEKVQTEKPAAPVEKATKAGIANVTGGDVKPAADKKQGDAPVKVAPASPAPANVKDVSKRPLAVEASKSPIVSNKTTVEKASTESTVAVEAPRTDVASALDHLFASANELKLKRGGDDGQDAGLHLMESVKRISELSEAALQQLQQGHPNTQKPAPVVEVKKPKVETPLKVADSKVEEHVEIKAQAKPTAKPAEKMSTKEKKPAVRVSTVSPRFKELVDNIAASKGVWIDEHKFSGTPRGLLDIGEELLARGSEFSVDNTDIAELEALSDKWEKLLTASHLLKALQEAFQGASETTFRSTAQKFREHKRIYDIYHGKAVQRATGTQWRLKFYEFEAHKQSVACGKLQEETKMDLHELLGIYGQYIVSLENLHGLYRDTPASLAHLAKTSLPTFHKLIETRYEAFLIDMEPFPHEVFADLSVDAARYALISCEDPVADAAYHQLVVSAFNFD